MELSSLPISESQREKLISAGYSTLSSLSSVSSSVIASELKIAESEAVRILEAASQRSRFHLTATQNAWDMLRDLVVLTRITTSSADLDRILSGGIKCREVTEIGGVPGIGKTQLGIQLAVNVQIPRECGGVEGKAIYIDTEGSFMVERALQIAEAGVEDMSKYDRFLRSEAQFCEFRIRSKDIMENIFYFRICSLMELIELINHLEKFISKQGNVKLVILDSIAFLVRQDCHDLAQRTRVLGTISSKLMKLAKEFNLAVVLLNQMTTKYADGSFQLSLAFGDSWSHSCTNRVILDWDGNERHAYIYKSPTLPPASTPYSVTSRGIRDASSHKQIRTT